VDQNTDELVAREHLSGTPVQLSLSGRISGIDGWSLANNTDFGMTINTVLREHL
jgi:hypothetical protein